MRTVCRENSCTGCMACIGKCTKNAITIKDSMVAYNAVIDEDKCINCGMCEKVCPNNQVVEKRKPIDWKESHSEQIYSVKKSALFNCSESDTFLMNYTIFEQKMQ